MAIEIGYWTDFKSEEERAAAFKEGPFVICNPLSNGYRIEVEQDGCQCPVLPDSTIFQFLEKHGRVGKTLDRDEMAYWCDKLNQMVRDGQIQKFKGSWRY